jgi:hypothetical protein
MSEIHKRQIKSYLQKTFNRFIDLSDYQDKSDKKRELIFFTRSLAAFALMVLADLSPQEASESIVTGRQDNGINSIYFDKRERIMYVLQSIWKQNSKGNIKEVRKFSRDFKNLVNPKYTKLVSKIINKNQDIEEALNDAATRFEIILVYSDQTRLADETKREFDNLLSEMNDPIDIVNMRLLNQENIYKIIKVYSLAETVNYGVEIFSS